jgi:hypothetical protein
MRGEFLGKSYVSGRTPGDQGIRSSLLFEGAFENRNLKIDVPSPEGVKIGRREDAHRAY